MHYIDVMSSRCGEECHKIPLEWNFKLEKRVPHILETLQPRLKMT